MTTTMLYFLRSFSTLDEELLVQGHISKPLDPHKTEEDMARALKGLSRIQFDAILCSPLEQAKATADLLVERLGIQKQAVEVIHDLIERNFGALEGKPVSELRNIGGITRIETNAFNQDVIVDGANVESLPSIYERARDIEEQIRNGFSEKKVLLISHRDLGQALKGAFLRNINDAFMKFQYCLPGESFNRNLASH